MLTARFDSHRLSADVRRLYVQSSRTLPQVLNQTALNVTGRAMNDTPRAYGPHIESSLGRLEKVSRLTKNGKIKTNTRVASLTLGQGKYAGVPIAALIINSRRRKAGKKGLQGKDMANAILKMLKARMRSIGFEASAWIPAVQELMKGIRSLGAKPFILAQMKGVAVYGRPKGDAKPATDGFTPRASITNNAKQIHKVGGRALDNAMTIESFEINKHIEEKIKKSAEEFNAAGKK